MALPPPNSSTNIAWKFVADLLKRLAEELFGRGVDLGDDLQQLFLGLDQVVVLLGEELEAFLQFVVFVDRLDIDRPHRVELGLQLGHLRFDGVPINRHLHLFADRRALVGDGDGDAVAADFFDVDLVFLPDAFLEGLDFHALLRELDVERGLLLLCVAGLLAQRPQFRLRVLDARGHLGALMLQTVQVLLGLRAGRAEFDDLLFRLADLLAELDDTGGVTGDFVRAGLHPFAQIMETAGNRFALGLDRFAFVLDAAHRHAQFGQLVRSLFAAQGQVVHRALRLADFLAPLRLARLGLAHGFEKFRPALLFLDVLLLDRVEFEDDRVDLVLQIALLGGQRAAFAFLAGQGDFLGVQFAAQPGAFLFERRFVLLQPGLARRRICRAGVECCGFLSQRADLRDVTGGHSAENAVFAQTFAAHRGHSQVRVALTDRQRRVEIVGDDDVAQQRLHQWGKPRITHTRDPGGANHALAHLL